MGKYGAGRTLTAGIHQDSGARVDESEGDSREPQGVGNDGRAE